MIGKVMGKIRDFPRELVISARLAVLAKQYGLEYRTRNPARTSIREAKKFGDSVGQQLEERITCPECKRKAIPNEDHVVRYTCEDCGRSWIADPIKLQ